MAVDFPSDLIADVARAADRDAVAEARARLAGTAAPAGETAAAFTGELAQPHPSVDKPSSPDAVDGDNEAMKRFEAMMLQQMIEQMLPKENSAVYGEGFAGDMWRSIQAEKLGESFAEHGGIGIARTLTAKLEGDAPSGSAIVDRITLQMLRSRQDG